MKRSLSILIAAVAMLAIPASAQANHSLTRTQATAEARATFGEAALNAVNSEGEKDFFEAFHGNTSTWMENTGSSSVKVILRVSCSPPDHGFICHATLTSATYEGWSDYGELTSNGCSWYEVGWTENPEPWGPLYRGSPAMSPASRRQRCHS